MTTYKEAGVDIENTDALVEDISELSKSTNRNGNFDKIGGFGGISILTLNKHFVVFSFVKLLLGT